jgi:hypothetical protein
MRKTFAEFVESVCSRPRLYVRHGSFVEVAACILGFHCGVISTDAERETGLDGFQIWVAEKLKNPHVHWSSTIEWIYPDDETRIEQLRLLFAEYTKTERDRRWRSIYHLT